MSLKLANGDVELDVKKYPMPVKGVAGKAKINGAEVDTMFTSGRGNSYTYFRLSNVDLYVAGALDPDTEFTLELPEGFGADEAPAARKSYYVRKRPAKDGEGEIPAGASEVPDGGPQAKTDEATGERVIEEQVERDGTTDASDEPIDETASAAEAPKSRRKGK